ncbi:4Fe-4S ferredoxin iron-sulfur binding domain protein [gut metagenome]|uniref:4Fe-4S ferredoxin iron-sulfur binding domain protein n=1 Tax=gut metagenome TaxID=749906 RepID=J9G3F4_9ZZZZ
MPLFADPHKCPQDHVCPLIKLCPVGAISQEGFSLPQFDPALCIKCGKCIRTCPMKAVYKA